MSTHRCYGDAVFPETLCDCCCLERIANSSAGTVAFDESSLMHFVLKTGLAVCPTHQSLLRSGTRHEHASRSSVAIDARAANHGSDRVSVLESLAQAFDVDGIDSLPTHNQNHKQNVDLAGEQAKELESYPRP